MSQYNDQRPCESFCRRQQTISVVCLGASLLALVCTFSIYIEQPTRSDLLDLAKRISQVEDHASVSQTLHAKDHFAQDSQDIDTAVFADAPRFRRNAGTDLRSSESRRATGGNARKKGSLDSVRFEATLPPHNTSILSKQDTIDMSSVDGHLTVAGFHPHSEQYNFWKMVGGNHSATRGFLHLSENHNHVTINKPGNYFVYAQVLYHDLSGRWAFGIFINDNEAARCITSQHLEPDYFQALPEGHRSSHGIYMHCNTATLVQMKRNQRLSIRALYPNRIVIADGKSTFWGIIKL